LLPDEAETQPSDEKMVRLIDNISGEKTHRQYQNEVCTRGKCSRGEVGQTGKREGGKLKVPEYNAKTAATQQCEAAGSISQLLSQFTLSTA
jgi:hypothetical protein